MPSKNMNKDKYTWNEQLCIQTTLICAPPLVVPTNQWTHNNQTLCWRPGLDIFQHKKHKVYYWSLYTNYNHEQIQVAVFEHKRFDEVSEELLNFCTTAYPELAYKLLNAKYPNQKQTESAL